LVCCDCLLFLEQLFFDAFILAKIREKNKLFPLKTQTPLVHSNEQVAFALQATKNIVASAELLLVTQGLDRIEF